MKLTPHDYQEETIQRVISEPTKGAILADDMGRGKTLQAVEIALRLGVERALYVGVKDTYDSWAERLLAQSDGKAVLRRMDSTKDGRAAFADFLAGEPGHYFAGSQFLTTQDWKHVPAFEADGKTAKWLRDKKTFEVITTESDAIGPREIPKRVNVREQKNIYRKMQPVGIIIYDEVHVVSNKRSVGLRTLRTVKTEWKLAMSGTFYGNKFQGAWSITRWVWPNLIDASSLRWEARWCETKDVYVAKDTAKAVIVGERHPGEFVKTLPCYLRTESDEKVPEPRIVHVDLSPAQRAQYDDLERDLVVWLDQHPNKKPLIADLPIVLRTRLRTATLGEMVFDAEGNVGFDLNSQSSKLFALRGILDCWAGEQALIYTDSKQFAKVTVARMRAAGYNAVEWSGDVSSKDRDAIKAAFLAGQVTYIVAVIPAFSTGLDGFQTVCSKLVWLSESESQVLNAQAVARLFRPGRVGEFEHVKLIARNTHDEGIYSSLVAQRIQSADTMRIAA